MLLNTLESRVGYRIRKSKDSVFTPKEFFDLSDRDQVARVLRNLIRNGELIKIGYGLYAKARVSSVTGNIIPEKPLPELAWEALRKIGAKPAISSMESLYNKGETTQVPTGRVIGIKERVSRKISYDGKYITFEKIAGQKSG